MQESSGYLFDSDAVGDVNPSIREGLSCICVVRNASGIHVRPAGAIVKLFEGETCEVSFSYGGKTINAKSIMSILMLGAPQHGEIVVTVKGKDASRVLQKIRDAFAVGFGEM